MFKVSFDGRIGRDARVITTNNGRFMSFPVATNRRIRKNEYATYWLEVTTNDEKHFKLAEYLKKGSAICVGGDLSPMKQTGQDGQERYVLRVSADYITFPTFSEKKQDGQQATSHASTTATEDDIRMNTAAPSVSTVPSEDVSPMAVSAEVSATEELPF